ncbi:MAG: magnesium transporter [Candidatus Paceibacterota bacterium]
MDIELEAKMRLIKNRANERLKLMRDLKLAEQSAVFQELSPHVQQALLAELKDSEITDMVDHMDPRQAENVLARIKDQKRRSRIIKKIKSEARDKIEFFLRFHPKATTSLISFNYVLLPTKATVAEAADAIDEHYQDTGTFPEVFVHENGDLVGEVPMSVLVRQRNSNGLKKLVQPVQTITYQAEVADVINTLTISKRKKVVVLDYDQSVLGVIYADDALTLFGKMPAESLYGVSGLDASERPFDLAWQKFRHRYKWLILNLATCFLAGSMIFVFSETLDRLVILAMYIPIVAGMGGNSASQTFAVMLRGITLGTISLKNGWPAIWQEIVAGLMNGLLIGAIVAIISIVWNQSALLGLVVGLSMIGVHLVAGFFGALVPLLLKHLGKDPAATSTIFISTATDVLGLFMLLGLGSLIML